MSDKDERSRKYPEGSYTAINKNSDSNYPAVLPGYKEIKINLSDILKLAYNSMIT